MENRCYLHNCATVNSAGTRLREGRKYYKYLTYANLFAIFCDFSLAVTSFHDVLFTFPPYCPLLAATSASLCCALLSHSCGRSPIKCIFLTFLRSKICIFRKFFVPLHSILNPASPLRTISTYSTQRVRKMDEFRTETTRVKAILDNA